jgi:hypothetical protein
MGGPDVADSGFYGIVSRWFVAIFDGRLYIVYCGFLKIWVVKGR